MNKPYSFLFTESSAYIRKIFKSPNLLKTYYKHDPHVLALMDKYHAGSHKVNPYAGNVAVGRDAKRLVDRQLDAVNDRNSIRAWARKGHNFDPNSTTFQHGMPFKKSSVGVAGSSIDIPLRDAPIDVKVNAHAHNAAWRQRNGDMGRKFVGGYMVK